jgi:hypothetical protein
LTNRWIPFRFTPAAWGLVGDAYDEAEAHYSLTGEALERKLANIRHKNDPTALQRELLDLDSRYGRISAYDAAIRRVEFDHPPGVTQDLARLDVDYEHGKLDKFTYQKQCANLKNEPWVAIINSGFEPEKGIDGVFFEFDWNDRWIEFLRNNGYAGHSDEQVIDEWFSDVCRSHGLNESLAFALNPA